MEELRKPARNFLFHIGVAPQDFALSVIEWLAENGHDMGKMNELAQVFMGIRPSGEG